MLKIETAHYIFYYNENSKAEQDIDKITEYQEECFNHICSTLKVEPQFKLEYYLCNSPEEVGNFCGELCGDYEPCNGFADSPNKIYAVYNEEIQCIGFHEDAHLISYVINRPESVAIREGLAMYFDQTWWGVSNQEWVSRFLKTGQYISVVQLLDDEIFYSKDCAITYPIMGAFTEWLIKSFGIEKYLQFYQYVDVKSGMVEVYQKTPEELNEDFMKSMKDTKRLLIKTDRLTIRYIVEADWTSIKVIRDDFALSPYSQYDIPFSTEENNIQARVSRWANANNGIEHMFFAICLDDVVIGYIAFNVRKNDYEIGYCFHSDYYGKGYAKESHVALFEYLKGMNITKFVARTALNNLPSVKLLKSLGFELVDTEKVSFYKDREGNDIIFNGGIFKLNIK